MKGRKGSPRLKPTAPEERRLRELYRTRFADDGHMEDVEHALTGFVGGLLFMGGPTAPDLAAELYRLACRAWHRNRDGYGHLNMAHPDERQTVALHSALLDAIERAEHYAARAVEEDAGPWAELGGEWAKFIGEGGEL